MCKSRLDVGLANGTRVHEQKRANSYRTYLYTHSESYIKIKEEFERLAVQEKRSGRSAAKFVNQRSREKSRKRASKVFRRDEETDEKPWSIYLRWVVGRLRWPELGFIMPWHKCSKPAFFFFLISLRMFATLRFL